MGKGGLSGWFGGELNFLQKGSLLGIPESLGDSIIKWEATTAVKPECASARLRWEGGERARASGLPSAQQFQVCASLCQLLRIIHAAHGAPSQEPAAGEDAAILQHGPSRQLRQDRAAPWNARRLSPPGRLLSASLASWPPALVIRCLTVSGSLYP